MSKPNSGLFKGTKGSLIKNSESSHQPNEHSDETRDDLSKKLKNNNVIYERKDQSGKRIYVTNIGLNHVKEEHIKEFVQREISVNDIAKFLVDATIDGTIVGIQGRNRPIYKYSYNGKIYYIAISVSQKGFIVGANFKSDKYEEKEKKK